MSAQPFDASSRYAAHVSGHIPDRKLNGGLYTGEPFAGDWGNVPIVPDSGSISNARYFFAHHHQVSHLRPGNNVPEPPRTSDVVVYPDISMIFPKKPLPQKSTLSATSRISSWPKRLC